MWLKPFAKLQRVCNSATTALRRASFLTTMVTVSDIGASNNKEGPARSDPSRAFLCLHTIRIYESLEDQGRKPVDEWVIVNRELPTFQQVQLVLTTRAFHSYSHGRYPPQIAFLGRRSHQKSQDWSDHISLSISAATSAALMLVDFQFISLPVVKRTLT